IERRRKRIDVRPRPLLAARLGVLLVRAVTGLHQCTDRPRMARDVTARRPEVDQHRRAVAADDDVVRRDVAMQEVSVVNDLEGIEQRRYDSVQLVLPWCPPETLEPALEALALLEVKHHVAGV